MANGSDLAPVWRRPIRLRFALVVGVAAMASGAAAQHPTIGPQVRIDVGGVHNSVAAR